MTIGGPSVADRNVISGNTQNVILQASGATVQNNFVGTNSVANAAIQGNPQQVNLAGIRSEGGNNIGLDGIGNVISGNQGSGVSSFGEGDHIESNLIGTDGTGTSSIGNGNGVILFGSDNVVGGDQPGAGNVISGNAPTPSALGVGVFAQEGHGNVIEGNLIGANATGDAAIPNVMGVQLDFGESDITIGGDTPGSRNVISGNSDKGIFVKNAAGTVISGNYVGTNAAGDAAIPNQIGIEILDPSTNTLVGGDSASERNVISGNRSPGNASRGILIDHADTVVSGNYIGLDSAGTHAIFNDIGILPIDAPDLVIGGASAGERNVISGNSTGIGTDFQNGMAIRGNYIGLNAAGTAAVPNIDWGSLIPAP